MRQSDIKKECEVAYSHIKLANEKLEYLRSICKHKKTFKGTYSYRVGSYQEADICFHCGKVINCFAEMNNTKSYETIRL